MASSRVLPVSYNEKTYGSAVSRDYGPGHSVNYTSLANWESDTDIDLVTATKGEVLTCYADSATYDDSVDMNGATCNSSYYRVIRSVNGQRGTPTSGVRFEKLNVSTYTVVLKLNEQYSSLYDLAAKCTMVTAVDNWNAAIGFISLSINNIISGCTAYDISGTGTATANGVGFEWYYNGVGSIKLINCYAVNCTGTNEVSGGIMNYNAQTGLNTLYVYNCTVISSKNGYYAFCQANNFPITTYITNCILVSNVTAIGNYTNWATITPLTNSTNNGINFNLDGYHLAKSDILALGQGTDLSATFSDDIDGETRPSGIWDIGCDQFLRTIGVSSGTSRITPSYYIEHTYGSDISRDYGPGHAVNYTSLANWESDTDVGLTTIKTGYVLTCYSDSATYDDSIDMYGAIPSSSYFRVLRSATGHRGTRTSGVRFENLSIGGFAFYACLQINESYSSIYDIAAKVTTSLASDCCVFKGYAGYTGHRFVGCTAYESLNVKALAAMYGFKMESTNNYIINCYAYNCIAEYTWTGGIFVTNTSYIYNCTSNNNTRGFVFFDNSTVTFTNNIYISNTTGLKQGTGVTLTSTTNVSSNVLFESDGFHLKAGFVGSARGQGTDLSATFTDDIDGDTITRGWSIGCDWYAPVTASNPSGTSRILPTYYYESTYGTSSRGYTALATWESDSDFNLTTQSVGEVLTCYADSSTYDDTVSMTGATTNSTSFRVLRSAEGHRGTPTKGVRFEKILTGAGLNIVTLTENYSGCYDIGISSSTTLNNQSVVGIYSMATMSKIIGCSIYNMSSSGTTGTAYGIFLGLYGGYSAVVVNCYITNCSGTSKGVGIYADTSYIGTNTFHLYNNTIKNCITGLYLNTFDATCIVVVNAKNIIFNECTTNTTTIGAGTETLTQTTCLTSGAIFQADDYHLQNVSNAGVANDAIDTGTNLSSAPTETVFPFNDDINGQTRQTLWDKGCDEYIPFIPQVTMIAF